MSDRIAYLSREWLRAASDAVATAPALDDDVRIGFAVTEAPDGDRSYDLVLGPDRVAYEAWTGDSPLLLRLPYDLAVSVATGAESAQRALLDGRISLEGDAGVLLGHGSLLAGLDDLLAELRSRTDY
ncbi:MAG: hypothetical protein ACRBI6_21475 [Acidimicrobiales bacterium]